MQIPPDETLDRLSATLRIFQRRKGHRATSDDVLVAGFGLNARPGARRILDLGTGKGTVALLLARRLPAARVVGVEAFAQSHELAVRNAALNGLSHRYAPLLGDLRDPTVLTGQAPFDLVCGAPPFMPLGTGILPRDPQRATGRFELRGGVEEYAACGFAHLAVDGRMVLLMDGHGRDRLVEACGSRLRRLIAICPRVGRPPTFWVGIAGGAGSTQRVDETFTMRTGEAWSLEYARMRAQLALDQPA